MYKILKNINLTKNIYLMEVSSPMSVKNATPGQFVIVMSDETSERIPLTICDYNKKEGSLTLIYQVVGYSSLELSHKQDYLFSVVGPLGKEALIIKNIEEYKNKKILFIGGGVGIAPILPQIKYLKEIGVNADCLYGVKSKDYIILENEIKNLVQNLYITTDDGSYGEKGLVSDKLIKIIDNYDILITVGPMVMMQSVQKIAKEKNKKIIVSMNPIMVDGTGMCGACRVVVDGEVKFACVDGPEFDGENIDFDLAIKRMNLYKSEEGRMFLKETEKESHHGGCGNCE